MKYVLFLLCCMFALTSCNPDSSPTNHQTAPLPDELAGEIDPMVAAQEENVALVRRYFDHFNAYEWEEMSQMYAEPAMFLDPAEGNEPFPMTRAKVLEKYDGLQNEVPGLQDSVLAIYPSGSDRVTIEFISKFTLPDGKSYRLPIVSIMRIMDGKIVEDRTYYDNF